MDKQKQIGEMARVICGFACDYENCDICPHNGVNVPCEYHDYAINLINAGYRKESEVRTETLNEVYAVLWKTPMRNAGTKARILNEIEKLGVKNGCSLRELIREEFKQQSSDLAQFITGMIKNLQQNVDYLSSVYGVEVE